MATHESASTSRADVLTAYGLCSAGDTLKVKAGSASWDGEIIITIPITIEGTGVTLTAGVVLSYGFFLLYNMTSDTLMRITGFTFNMNTYTGGVAIGFSTTNLSQLRIDHNTFHHGSIVMEIVGCRGVVDSNYFYNGYESIIYNGGTRTQGDASWLSMAAGTSDALFIENNHFIYNGDFTGPDNGGLCIDTNAGGKLVVRYNVADFTAVPVTWTSQSYFMQQHGSAGAGAPVAYWQADATARRGQSVVEIYNNTVTGKYLERLVSLRGSANLVHDNTINSSTYGTIVYMYEEEQYNTDEWDPLRTAWPAEDQVHNTFFWNNTFNGVAQQESNFVVAETSTDYIQLNRDYFIHRPATIGEGMTLGKEVFTGANGGSNTYPTNGVVYPTLGSMSFVSDVENAYYGYVPYTYPHPLRGEGANPWVMIYG